MLGLELAQAVAQVGAVVARRHPGQHFPHRLVDAQGGQVGRHVFQVIDEGEAAHLLHLILKLVEHPQEELGHRAHRGADIEDDHQLGLAPPLLHPDLKGHAAIAEVGPQGGFDIQLALLPPLLPQGRAAAQAVGQPPYFVA